MIQAKVIADSKTPTGERLTTLEVIMPRYILAEFNTHRMLSKNSASSRAIPLRKMLLEVIHRPFIPYAFQEDHKGMQGTTYLNDEYEFSLSEFMGKAKDFITGTDSDESLDFYVNIVNQYKHKRLTLKEWWLLARDKAVEVVTLLSVFGVTKQLANRLLEPFMYHKVLVSGTEWENFFNLRCPEYTLVSKDKEKETVGYKSWKDFSITYHLNSEISHTEILEYNKGQADIHMMFLAEAIYDAKNESIPKELKEEEWHIPYGDNMNTDELAKAIHKTSGSFSTTLEEAQCKISIARCARLSYQTLGDNPVIDYEKDLQLYEVLSKSGHWSPFEHVAKVMTPHEYRNNIKGIAENKGDDDFKFMVIPEKATGWCRNYRGFIQYRELLDN